MTPYPIVHAQSGRIDERDQVIALRAEVARLERERDAAVARAEKAEMRAAYYHTAYHRKTTPELHRIGGH